MEDSDIMEDSDRQKKRQKIIKQLKKLKNYNYGERYSKIKGFTRNRVLKVKNFIKKKRNFLNFSFYAGSTVYLFVAIVNSHTEYQQFVFNKSMAIEKLAIDKKVQSTRLDIEKNRIQIEAKQLHLQFLQRNIELALEFFHPVIDISMKVWVSKIVINHVDQVFRSLYEFLKITNLPTKTEKSDPVTTKKQPNASTSSSQKLQTETNIPKFFEDKHLVPQNLSLDLFETAASIVANQSTLWQDDATMSLSEKQVIGNPKNTFSRLSKQDNKILKKAKMSYSDDKPNLFVKAIKWVGGPVGLNKNDRPALTTQWKNPNWEPADPDTSGSYYSYPKYDKLAQSSATKLNKKVTTKSNTESKTLEEIILVMQPRGYLSVVGDAPVAKINTLIPASELNQQDDSSTFKLATESQSQEYLRNKEEYLKTNKQLDSYFFKKHEKVVPIDLSQKDSFSSKNDMLGQLDIIQSHIEKTK